MKKKYILFISFITAAILIFSCATTQAEKSFVDMDFAKDIAIKAINGNHEELIQIDNQLASMMTADLMALKDLLTVIITQDPPFTTSIAETWILYGIIYKIDDILGTLEYSTVIEGIFDWDSATSLLGTTELDFLMDDGKKIFIFATVATVDKYSAYIKSDGRRVRLYIKEDNMSNGKKRNEVVKIEPMY